MSQRCVSHEQVADFKAPAHVLNQQRAAGTGERRKTLRQDEELAIGRARLALTNRSRATAGESDAISLRIARGS